MPRVTDVLDYYLEPELVEWKLKKGKREAERISQEAKRIGTAVDLRIRALVQSQTLAETNEPEILNCLRAWRTHCQQHPTYIQGIQAIQTELRDGELVGHPDFELVEAQGWGIDDVKTSRMIQPKHWTQVAKYADLKMRQQGLAFPSFIGILRLDKGTGEPEWQRLTDPEEIRYEISVFDAYWLTYRHAERVRARTRRMAEEEAWG